MRLIENVLHRIRDDDHLAIQIAEHHSVFELVEAYNAFVLADDTIPQGGMYAATGQTYGSELKRYINYLPASEQLKLLNRYLGHFPESRETKPTRRRQRPAANNDTVADQEQRRHHHFLIKTVVIFCLVMTFVVVGIMLKIMWDKQVLPDGVVIQALMGTAAEVIKLLFSK